MEDRIKALEERVYRLTKRLDEIAPEEEVNEYDHMTPEERAEYDEWLREDQEERELERVITECSCGAYRILQGKLIQVADCCC